MIYSKIIKNKQIVGFIANILSVYVLIRCLLSTRFIVISTKNLTIFLDRAEIFSFCIYSLSLILIIVSSHFFKKNMIQTKGNIIGKMLALFFAVFIVVSALLHKATFHALDAWILFVFFVANVIITPYSFYLLSRKSIVTNLKSQSDDSQNINSSPIE